MGNFLDRTIKVLGIDKVNSFNDKVILVAGIGGVGGTALEALARSGFSKFILIDFDRVDESNLNRQILFLRKDIDKEKVDVAKEKLLEINPDIEVKLIKEKIDTNSLKDLNEKIDFVIDAIDYVPGKLELIQFALNKNIPFISSLGMGNRIDPTKVSICKLNQTEGDPLARKIRYECRLLGLELSKINVVFSKEVPLIKSKAPGSMMMAPSSAGLSIARYIIENLK